MTRKKKFCRKQIWSRNLFSEKNSEQKRFLAFSSVDLVKFFLKKYDRKKNLTGKKNCVEKKFGQEIYAQKKILNKKVFWPLAVGTW